MTDVRPIDLDESRRIGQLIGDPFVTAGHPLTCNGGNPNCGSHHDTEVRMLLDEPRNTLVCPNCGRVQQLPFELDPDDCEHGRWNPDNDQCLDCGASLEGN